MSKTCNCLYMVLIDLPSVQFKKKKKKRKKKNWQWGQKVSLRLTTFFYDGIYNKVHFSSGSGKQGIIFLWGCLLTSSLWLLLSPSHSAVRCWLNQVRDGRRRNTSTADGTDNVSTLCRVSIHTNFLSDSRKKKGANVTCTQLGVGQQQ